MQEQSGLNKIKRITNILKLKLKLTISEVPRVISISIKTQPPN